MKLTAMTTPAAIIDALGLSTEGEQKLRDILDAEEVKLGERIEFDVEVDADEAFDKLEAAGAIPSSELSDLLEIDELVDAVRAALDGDRHMALLLFTRAIGGDSDAARRIEDVIRGRPAAGQAPLPLLTAA